MVEKSENPNVGLFVTCLVDAMRPSIGYASIRLLEAAGCRVAVPETQTCCGQPAYNSGADGHARDLLKSVIAAFEVFDYVVVPSGSCAGMLKAHGGDLFADEPEWAKRHQAVAAKTYEILSFLADVMDFRPEGVRYDGVIAYHDSCSGLRELGVHAQPRALLDAVEGARRVPLEGDNVCCGFGGTFCVKYPDISNQIVTDKTRCIARSGADTLLAGDMGCLMNMAGKLTRNGENMRVFHTVEVLAGMADGPGICQGDADVAPGGRKAGG